MFRKHCSRGRREPSPKTTHPGGRCGGEQNTAEPAGLQYLS